MVVQGYFDLRYAENPGVAFSMLQDLPGGRLLLTLLAIAAFALVLVYLRKTPVESTRLHIALGLVGGGAIGNLIDRMLYGKVTDFIVWKVGVHEWPAYNIADAALCVGVGLMVLDMFLTRRRGSVLGLRPRQRRSFGGVALHPVLFTFPLGRREIALHSYGLLIAAGLAVGIWLAHREGRRRGLDQGRVLDLAFWLVVSGLVGRA